jgi:hypothetical protein
MLNSEIACDSISGAKLKRCNYSGDEKPVANGLGFLFWGMYFYYGEVAEIICKLEREICIEKKGVGRYFLWEGLTAI